MGVLGTSISENLEERLSFGGERWGGDVSEVARDCYGHWARHQPNKRERIAST